MKIFTLLNRIILALLKCNQPFNQRAIEVCLLGVTLSCCVCRGRSSRCGLNLLLDRFRLVGSVTAFGAFFFGINSLLIFVFLWFLVSDFTERLMVAAVAVLSHYSSLSVWSDILFADRVRFSISWDEDCGAEWMCCHEIVDVCRGWFLEKVRLLLRNELLCLYVLLFLVQRTTVILLWFSVACLYSKKFVFVG